MLAWLAGRKKNHCPIFHSARLITCFLMGCMALLVSACLPEVETPLPPTVTPTVTLTPTTTATIVWFPPTATYTPMPTRMVEPTQDLRPPLGEVLFEDPFTDKTQWLTSRSAAGNIAYGNSELTLAVSQPRGMLLSLRKSPTIGNFYLEIDAVPSLCRGADSYGLLLRSESSQDYYRFAASCTGQVRMERVKNGRSVPLQDWMTSGQILPGGMMRVRLGVWALGQDLRVFVNGDYHFSVKDPVFTAGSVGVFARAAGDTPLTVSFSNLVVYGSEPAGSPVLLPTATRIPPLLAPTATRKPASP